MGKNKVSDVPHEIAKFLSVPECDKYTFHSFRRTAATSTADAGSSTEQLIDFFGWKNGSMCQEYISSSKPAIVGMASRLGGFEALSQDPVMEVEEEMEKDPLDTKSIGRRWRSTMCAMAVTVNVKIVVLNNNSGNLTFL
jgi:hypothetical protein